MLKNTLFGLVYLFLFVAVSSSQSIDIHGPEGSGRFGTSTATLPTGNFVVTDPDFDPDEKLTNAGAVYLYSGSSGQLISTMVGERPNDRIGSGGIRVLTSGDYLVLSPEWDGVVPDVSAVTRCSGFTGCPAAVTAENSLTGSSTGDNIGDSGVFVLSSGNYVIASRSWDNDAVADAGAVTFCSREMGCPLSISPENSLVGSHTGDMVQVENVILLANGNYVVKNSHWDNGSIADAGAVTLGNGETGISGVVSAENSLVGTHLNDIIGSGGVFPLPNGNYVVASHSFDNASIADAGAVTFCSGTTSLTGPILSFDSLIGLVQGDSVGLGGVTVLDNGNYVVGSPLWHNGNQTSAGAVTWGSMNTGIVGSISESNSMVGAAAFNQVGGKIVALRNSNYVIVSQYSAVGSETMRGAITLGNGNSGSTGIVSKGNSLIGKTNDRLGDGGVYPLINGNYVVSSPFWRNGKQINAGAVTFGYGSAPLSGTVTPQNSLVGTTAGDKVGGDGIVALANGNYVVRSTFWHNAGAEGAGAVTWGNGFSGGISGAVSTANSLVGTASGDRIGLVATALTNGNYVAGSPTWNGSTGAATWGNGDTGIAGPVTTGNSLTGAASGQAVTSGCGITPLINGNYVVCTPTFNADAGAVTWGNGATGVRGTVSTANSLTGVLAGDGVGSDPIRTLLNGNYIVRSPFFGSGDSGAITRGNGSMGTRGPVSAANSVLGIAANGGIDIQVVIDTVNDQIIVSRPADNIVTLYRMQASVSVAGRVTASNGQPIANALVRLVAQDGQVRTAQTGSLGYYSFDTVATGQEYTISASAKRYRFASPRNVFIDNDIADLDFTAQPQ